MKIWLPLLLVCILLFLSQLDVRYEVLFQVLAGIVAYTLLLAAIFFIHMGRSTRTLRNSRNALLRAEQRLSTIIEFLPDATIVINEDGIVTAWNKAAETKTGIRAQEMLGKGDFEYAIPFTGMRKPILSELPSKTGEAGGAEHSGAGLDAVAEDEKQITGLPAGDLHVHLSTARLYDASGNMAGGIICIRDISKRKLAEKKLLESERRYRNIFQNSPFAIWEADLSGIRESLNCIEGEEGIRKELERHPERVAQCMPMVRLISINSASLSMFGVESREMLTENISQIFNECSLPGLTDIFTTLAEGKPECEGEIICMPLTGGSRTLFYKYFGLSDSNSEQSAALITFMDITERKKNEQAVMASEKRFKELADLLPQGVFEIDCSGRINFANRMCSVYLGYSAEEFRSGLSAFDMILPSEREKMDIGIANLFGSGHVNVDYSLRRKDGTSFPVSIYASPIVYGEVIEGIRGIIVDITERRKSEEALRAARAYEMEIGQKIQKSLLIGEPPGKLPGRVATLSIPSRLVDGDFFDFFVHSDDCFDLVIGDVMGKGIPAALIGAGLKSSIMRTLNYLMATSRDKSSPPRAEKIIKTLHEDITHQLMKLRVFSTLCYARFHFDCRRMSIVDCGHTSVIHYHARSRSCLLIDGEFLPLGVSEDEIYRERSRLFEPGDVFLFYSDGVTDVENRNGETFGVRRLTRLVSIYAQAEPKDMIERILGELYAFSGSQTFSDDFTCIAFKYLPSAQDAPLLSKELAVSSSPAELEGISSFMWSICQDIPWIGSDEVSVFKIELAVHEAATNIIRHAYRGRTDREMTVRADVYRESLAVTVFHDGELFDVEDIRPPVFDGSMKSGFGLYFIECCVDNVFYGVDGRGKKFICLIKGKDGIGRFGMKSGKGS